MRQYATMGQFASSPFSDGGDATEAELIRASLKVDDVLLSARYDTDAEGMPTDPAVADALAAATCAQVAYFRDTGDPSGAGEYAGVSGTRLAPEAVGILRRVGLLNPVVWHG